MLATVLDVSIAPSGLSIREERSAPDAADHAADQPDVQRMAAAVGHYYSKCAIARIPCRRQWPTSPTHTVSAEYLVARFPTPRTSATSTYSRTCRRCGQPTR